MIKTIALSTIVAAALAAATFWLTAEPASAKNYEYCRVDYGLGSPRDCSFNTMEQCLAMIPGRGGSCTRDPSYQSESLRTLLKIPAVDTGKACRILPSVLAHIRARTLPISLLGLRSRPMRSRAAKFPRFIEGQ